MSVTSEADDEAGVGSLRTCIVSRQARSPEELIRFVLDPDGRVTPDLRRKLPGRGVWVTASAGAVRQAVKSHAFARSLKSPAEATDALADDVDKLLERDALQSLSFANKAGLIVTGATKVEATIAKEPVLALLHAVEGGADGVRKLRQALARRWGEAGVRLPLVHAFSSAQLDLALGRSNVIHAALKKGPAGEAFLARCIRLAAYRHIEGAPQTEEIDARPDAVLKDDAAGIRNG